MIHFTRPESQDSAIEPIKTHLKHLILFQVAKSHQNLSGKGIIGPKYQRKVFEEDILRTYQAMHFSKAKREIQIIVK